MQISNRPITWQQLSAPRHVDKMTCWGPKCASERGRIEVTECGVTAGARRAGLSMSDSFLSENIFEEWELPDCFNLLGRQ